ncbi:MAG: dethiobiotin synthase [Planctomycetota bacterium]
MGESQAIGGPAAGPPGLFVTGTDTEVGKTYVTALIARQLVAEGRRVGVYKPVASGCVPESGGLVSEDAAALWEAAGRPLSLRQVCPQRFKAPVAPNRSAAAEGKTVDAGLLRSGVDPWTASGADGRPAFDFVLVEGAGGLLSPISDADYVADLAIDLHARFGWPLLVAAANKLGTINATLQTVITASAYRTGLPVAGVVLSQVAERPDTSAASNHLDIARSSPAPLLADVRFGGGFEEAIDWLSLATAP